jgi:hypothetical protein
VLNSEKEYLMRTPFILALLLVFLALGLAPGHAAENIRAALYMAENEPPPPGSQAAPPKLNQQLQAVFGYTHYHLLKQQSFPLKNEWKQWFVPRRDFFVSIEPLHHAPGEPKLIAYEIYKDGFSLVKGTYEPHEETPLFVNGPFYHRGQLILVLEAH